MLSITNGHTANEVVLVKHPKAWMRLEASLVWK